MYMPSLMPATDGCPEDTESLETIIASLLRLLQMKNQKIFLHSNQVANYAVSTAAKMRLPKEEIERIRHAALLHDIGLLTVPNAVFAKLPYLSTRESSVYRNHCNAGSWMLENIAPCQDLIPYIRYHHERFDGKGYPNRLKGVNIPLGARIIAVANGYDRYINPCTQHWAKTNGDAIRELLNLSGTAYDPEVVKAFIEAMGLK